MLTTQKTTDWKAFPEQGGFFRLERGTLLYAPMTTNGGIDVESACEVDFDRIDKEQVQAARCAEDVLQKSLRVSLWRRIRRAFHQWWDCVTENCDYYNHYLAYGPADLTHEGYHAACRKCEEWQKRDSDYFLNHPNAVTSPFQRQCEIWEKRVRA